MLTAHSLLLASCIVGSLLGSSPAWAAPSSPRCAPTLIRRGADAETRAILERIRKEGARAPSSLLEQLGKRKDADGFSALKEAIEIMQEVGSGRAAMRALRHFKGVEPFESRAVAVLIEALESRDFVVALSAKGVLVEFGEAAVGALEKTARRAKRARTRALAVGALLPILAERGDADALKLIFESYDKVGSGSYDNLIEALARFDGQQIGRALKTGLTDKSVVAPLRVAVIRGVTKLEGDSVSVALVAAMEVKHGSVAVAAVYALQERGYTAHKNALKRHSKSRNREMRYAANVGLACLPNSKLASKSLATVFQGCKSEDPRERTLAFNSLKRLQGPEVLEALAAYLHDEQLELRKATVDLLGATRQRESLPFLIEHLGREQDSELKQHTLDTLRLLTGLNHGASSARWRRWWEAEGVEFQLPTLEEAELADKARRRAEWERNERYTFFGLEVKSERAIFILDASGSMKRENKAGVSRLEKAKRQLSSVLKRFPDGAHFNVIFFGSTVQAYSDELIEMNEDSRKQVLASVEAQKTLGSTAIYDALKAGFAYEGIDTIYLLSDGTPAGGEIDDVDEIRGWVKTWNRKRRPKIVLHCVALGSHSKLLGWLADDSGGKLVEEPDD